MSTLHTLARMLKMTACGLVGVLAYKYHPVVAAVGEPIDMRPLVWGVVGGVALAWAILRAPTIGR